MKIKIGSWVVDSKSLIRVYWNKYYPKFVIHEKFEKHVKWVLRILAGTGILTSLLTLPYFVGVGLTIFLSITEQILEKIVFEYSVMILQPLPNFEIDYKQWITNGYFLLNPDVPTGDGYVNYFGPTYKDRDYAIEFFGYIRSWNPDLDTDFDNNICVSFVVESDNSYSTFLYANPDRKWLSPMLYQVKQSLQLIKFGKSQQSIVLQMVYWKNLELVDGMYFTKFIKQQKRNQEFFFVPFYEIDGQAEMIEELGILKNSYKIKHRSELTEDDLEYHYK